MQTQKSRSTAAIWRLCLFGLLVVTTGCGNGLSQVTGKITQDGQPLATGGDVKVTVQFQPSSGDGVPAVGVTDTNGEYQLSTGSKLGIVPGEYYVTCDGVQLLPPSGPGGTPGGKRITDRKYTSGSTSGLRFTVKEGENRYDIALESVPKP